MLRYTYSPLTSCLLACISIAYWLLISHNKAIIDALFCMTNYHAVNEFTLNNLLITLY